MFVHTFVNACRSSRRQAPNAAGIAWARRAHAPVLISFVVGLAGCTTLPGGEPWGEKAGFSVGWARTEQAAIQAARDPWVWAPLAGAAVMQVDNWDHRVSNWAVDNTPVFGSVRNAHDWSDYLRDAAGVTWLVSVAAAPSGDDGSEWWDAKLHGGMVEFGAVLATGATTEVLKSVAGRYRPDGGHNSFPSGHTSFAAVADTLSARNFASMPMSDGARTATNLSLDALTLATGWARVEAGAHYPSDVLVGMSIGHFFGRMFSDAFLGDELSNRLAFSVEPAKGGAEVAFDWRF